jgi:uncharacterized membrane protein
VDGAELGLALSVFAASAVEAVEALTIVMAVGQTRSWSSALGGAAAAGVALIALVAVVGTAIGNLPIDDLRLLVGLLLLLFGLQWLRKAILRAAGRKALHDELGEYEHETAAALAAEPSHGKWDPYSFTVSFKGVLLEGVEVAIIVVTFGANHHRIGIAAAAAVLAVVVVILAGLAVKAPLARVPENTLKFAVGVMLCSFGLFWTLEGAGVEWPGGNASLLLIAPATLAASMAVVASLRRTAPR